MDKIKILICDDVEAVCLYFQNIIKNEDDLELMGMAHNSLECVELVQKIKPDVLLLDIQMETEDAGIRIIPTLLEISPDTKIIILSIHRDETFVFQALMRGASDYLNKEVSSDEFLKAIRDIYNNSITIRPEISNVLLNQSRLLAQKNSSLLYVVNAISKLSTAEYEVLQALCNGLSYRTIAKKRFVEENTIRAQVVNIVKKFGAANIKQLVKELNELDVFKILEGNG